MDYLTGEPIEGAELDVWHTAPNGFYEQQDEHQVTSTFEDGSQQVESVATISTAYGLLHSYPIPLDGQEALQVLDRHPMRPAHTHFIVSPPDYQPIITQFFD